MTSADDSYLDEDSGDARVTVELADHGQKWPLGESIEAPTLRELLALLVSLSEDERTIVLANALALAKALAGRCGPS